MSFTTQLLKGYVMSDIVKVVNRYLIPKYIDFEGICKYGLIEELILVDIEFYANINFTRGFYFACQYGYVEIVNWLIKNRFDYDNILNVYLSTACRFKHLDICKLLIVYGAYHCTNCVNHEFII
jgi:hypothetical protein